MMEKTFLDDKNKKLREATLCFLLNKDKVLLGFKKRGFGKGKWNGIGGKPQKKETIKNAAIREIKEEVGVIANDIIRMGKIDFYFKNNPEFNQRVIIFTCNTWKEKPIETDEMRPKWFFINRLPFKKMWDDDTYWLPRVLSGQKINAWFLFNEHEKIIDFKVIS